MTAAAPVIAENVLLTGTQDEHDGGIDGEDVRLGNDPVGIGRSVIDVHGVRDAPRSQRQPHGVLGVAPPVAGQQPGVIVQERKQKRLERLNSYAVQRISSPKRVRVLGLESRPIPIHTRQALILIP